MEKKNESIITREDFENIEHAIEKEMREIDMPQVDAILDKKFGPQQFVGNSGMRSEAQRQEGERREKMRETMLANRLNIRHQTHYEPFGGRDAVVKNFAPEAGINKTQKTQDKTEKASSLKAHYETHKGQAKTSADKSFGKSKDKSK